MEDQTNEPRTHNQRREDWPDRVTRHLIAVVRGGVVQGSDEDFTTFCAEPGHNGSTVRLFPDRLAAPNNRQMTEIAAWRRRARSPLQRSCTPGIVPGDETMPPAPQYIGDKK